MPIFNFRNPIEYPLGLLELLASGATGAAGQVAGVPIGLLKSADKYGTQEGVREAEKEAQRVSSALTYLPRTETAREMASLLGKAVEASKLPPIIPEAQSLLAMSQMPKQAYVAQGMNIEKAAEPVVRQIMERGGMPASLLEGMSSRTVSPLTVYHGSPAKFTKFDPTKIGSGEGAQAYGYGHYVAESPAVAREYQKNLANPIKDQTDTAFITARTAFVKGDGDVKKAMKYLDQQQKVTEEASGFLVDKGQKSLSDIEQARGLLKSGAMQPGNMYEIDLPDEQIAKMLDWDKPVSQQKDVMAALNSVAEKNVKDKVRNDIENEIRASGVLPTDKTGDDYMSLLFGQSDETLAKADQMLKQLADEKMAKIDFAPLIKNELEGMKPATMTWDATGKDFYEMLAKRSGSPEKASALFKEQGVPGIRYLDQGSRSPGGSDTSNFVVFPGNEGLLTIQKRNNEVIAPTSLLDYRGSHTAPGPDFGAPLHDLTGGGQMYPADVYSPKAAQYYGTGYPKADKEAFDLAKRVKGNPDAEVTMYRAVPNNKDITDINAGDWVTLSKDYAKTHGESALQGDYKIISKKVKAKDLWTNADSIHEFGYHPQ